MHSPFKNKPSLLAADFQSAADAHFRGNLTRNGNRALISQRAKHVNHRLLYRRFSRNVDSRQKNVVHRLNCRRNTKCRAYAERLNHRARRERNLLLLIGKELLHRLHVQCQCRAEQVALNLRLASLAQRPQNPSGGRIGLRPVSCGLQGSGEGRRQPQQGV